MMWKKNRTNKPKNVSLAQLKEISDYKCEGFESSRTIFKVNDKTISKTISIIQLKLGPPKYYKL